MFASGNFNKKSSILNANNNSRPSKKSSSVKTLTPLDNKAYLDQDYCIISLKSNRKFQAENSFAPAKD